MGEKFTWVKPSRLWQADAQDFRQSDFFQPRLLEFQTDRFMDDFFKAAGARSPGAFRQAVLAPADGETAKLYQPAHQRYYLLCSSLCCATAGFPDRAARLADGERVSFVLRRLFNRAEYGWVADGPSKGWQPVPAGAPLVDAKGAPEERLPLHAVPTADGRTVLFGYVPVASRDTYPAPAAQSPVDTTEDVRLGELQARFLDPLDPAQSGQTFKSTDGGVQLQVSVYLLLELWDYLAQYLPEVTTASLAGTTNSLTGPEKDLADYLQAQTITGSLTLAGALAQVGGKQADLNQPGGGDLGALGFDGTYNLKNYAPDAAGLKAKVGAALPPTQPLIEVPKLAVQPGALYLLRCVYERPQCFPPQVWVSQPSVQFTLAPYFDPDAPARQIRIGLPVDISIAGLRKFKKGVSFLMSNALKKKLDCLEGQGQNVFTGPAQCNDTATTLDLGHICSFSIPIITICAFVLLLVIVIVLNIAFWWLPFFRICLPLNLKVKS
jgi:hypothetical protein